MARPARVHHPGGFYHVTLRGNHRASIFDEAGDRDRWEDLLAEALARTGAAVHAYCWMTNHVHLVVQVGDAPLEGLVRRLASSYSRWYQRRIPTTGHLFERRYRAQLIRSDAYLLASTRYIHYNPVRARLAPDPGAYPWSSHRAYATGATQPWLTLAFVLAAFDPDPGRARRGYLDFMAVAPGEPPTADPAAVEPASAAPPVRATPDDGRGVSLAQIVAGIAAAHGLTLDALRSGSRVRAVTRVRALIAIEATASGAATLADVARLLGRTPSAIAQAVATLRRSGPPVAGKPKFPK